MDLSLITSFLCLAGFAGLCLAAAITDIQRRKIPNGITLVIALLFGIYFLANLGEVDWVGPLVVGGAILAVGFLIFAMNWLGAGDVKMLAAAGLWAGFAHVTELLLVTGLAGGILGLGYVLGDRLRRVPWIPLPPPEVKDLEELKKQKIYLPYGVAICAGALVVALQKARDLSAGAF
ncbi:MAG: prepilin peptidase [Limibacillus sp.]|jgi:prepilin peptidase CpaA